MATWLDGIVTQLKTPGSADAQALAFVEGNYNTLLPLGLDSITDILTLLQSGQTQQAMITLESRLTDPEVIAAYEQQNSQVCAAREKSIEDIKANIEKFVVTLLPIAVKVGMTIASGG